MRDCYLSGDYFEGSDAGYADYAAQEKSLRRTFRRLLRGLARRGMTGGKTGGPIGGSVLEVGCGYGFFLDEAAAFAGRRYGTEMSPAAARRAEALNQAAARNLQIYAGGLEAVPADLEVDLIVALHVIEHIYDPVSFVEAAMRHLAPGGRIVLAAPDMGSFWRLAMGRAWPSFKFPEHVSFFDARTLASLMAKAGLTDLERLPYGHDFPLDEIMRKLGLPAPGLLGRISVPLPATTICFAGRKPDSAPDLGEAAAPDFVEASAR